MKPEAGNCLAKKTVAVDTLADIDEVSVVPFDENIANVQLSGN